MAPLGSAERSVLTVPVTQPLVVYEDVHKRFGDKIVLDGFNLQVKHGETLVLLGRSGTGKSVALKILLGLVRPESGRVKVAGEDITSHSERELTRIRRHMGMVFQGGALFDSMTVLDNIAYGLVELYRWPEDRVRARVAECLELVDLRGIEHLYPGALSGGMAKRVAIARAIATSPELLLYDEPTTGLDPATAEHVDELVKGLQTKLEVTSIVVTHDMHSAFSIADRMALIERGKIVWLGPVDVARSDPPEPLARFLGTDDEDEDQAQKKGKPTWKPRARSR